MLAIFAQFQIFLVFVIIRESILISYISMNYYSCFSLLIFCYLGYDLCFATYVEFLLTYMRYYNKYNKLSWSYVSESRTQVHTTLQQLAALKVKRFLHIPHNYFSLAIIIIKSILTQKHSFEKYPAVNPILQFILHFSIQMFL